MSYKYSDVAILGTDTLYDMSAVKQSILSILKTVKGERLFRPTFGSGLEECLWQPMGEDAAQQIKMEVKSALAQDTRATLQELTVTPDYNNSRYDVSVTLIVSGVEDTLSLQLKKKGL